MRLTFWGPGVFFPESEVNTITVSVFAPLLKLVEHIQSLIALREKRLFPDERGVGEAVHGVDGDDPGGGGESLDQIVVLCHLAVLHMDCLHLQPLTQHSSSFLLNLVFS